MIDDTKIDIGLVLNIYEQDEFDALIKVMFKDKIIFLFAKGFYKLESKNKINTIIGSFSEFEYFNSYKKNDKTYLLKKSTLIKALNLYDNDLINFNEKLLNILQLVEDQNLNLFEAYYNFLNNDEYENKTYLLTYLLFEALKTKGRTLVGKCCVVCKTNQNLYTFNLNSGGMLCLNHKYKNPKMDIDILKAFYYLDKSFNEYKLNSNESINKFIFSLLNSFNHS